MEGSATILIVEDDPGNQYLFSRFLEFAGHHVIIAGDAEQALGFLAVIQADIILMDINLPVVNGIELFQLLNSLPQIPEIPVVAVTASCADTTRHRCLDAGFDGYLNKPVSRYQLLDTINQTLEARLAMKKNEFKPMIAP